MRAHNTPVADFRSPSQLADDRIGIRTAELAHLARLPLRSLRLPGGTGIREPF